MSEFEYATGKQAGWICPICGRVYAPWVPECTWHDPGKMNNGFNDLMSGEANKYKELVDSSNIDWPHKDSKTNAENGKYYEHLTK